MSHWKALVWIVITGLYFVIFSPSMDMMYRGEQWIVVFMESVNNVWARMVEVATQEYFGHLRFQPLAFFIPYGTYAIFGNWFPGHHITAIALTFLCGWATLVLAGRFQFSFWTRVSVFCLCVFSFNIFEVNNWTYSGYIQLSVALAILASHYYLKYYETETISDMIRAIILTVLSVIMYEVFALLFMLGACLFLWKHSRKPYLRNGFLIACVLAFIVMPYVAARTDAIPDKGFPLYMYSHFCANLLSFIVMIAKGFLVFFNDIELLIIVQLKQVMWVRSALYMYPFLFGGIFILLITGFYLYCKKYGNKKLYIYSLLFLALATLFIVTAGRTTTNPRYYIAQQFRYHYIALFFIVPLLVFAGKTFFGEFKAIRYLFFLYTLVYVFSNSVDIYRANHHIHGLQVPARYVYDRIRSDNPDWDDKAVNKRFIEAVINKEIPLKFPDRYVTFNSTKHFTYNLRPGMIDYYKKVKRLNSEK